MDTCTQFLYSSSFVLLNWVSDFSFSFREGENVLSLWTQLCMAGQRIGETGLSESGPSSHHVPYGVLHGINTSASSLMYCSSNFSQSQFSVLSTLWKFFLHGTSVILCFFLQFWFLFFFLFLRNQGSGFDFGELEEAFALQGIKIRSDEAKACMFHCFSSSSSSSSYDEHNLWNLNDVLTPWLPFHMIDAHKSLYFWWSSEIFLSVIVAALFTGRPSATLEMFPSWPMRFHQTPRVLLSLSLSLSLLHLWPIHIQKDA